MLIFKIPAQQGYSHTRGGLSLFARLYSDQFRVFPTRVGVYRTEFCAQARLTESSPPRWGSSPRQQGSGRVFGSSPHTVGHQPKACASARAVQGSSDATHGAVSKVVGGTRPAAHFTSSCPAAAAPQFPPPVVTTRLFPTSVVVALNERGCRSSPASWTYSGLRGNRPIRLGWLWRGVRCSTPLGGWTCQLLPRWVTGRGITIAAGAAPPAPVAVQMCPDAGEACM